MCGLRHLSPGQVVSEAKPEYPRTRRRQAGTGTPCTQNARWQETAMLYFLAGARSGSGGALLHPAHEDAGDVVRAAVLVGALDELRPGDLDLLVLGEDPGDVLVAHRAGEAVRADQDHVTELGLLEAGVDLDRVLHPERPHDHVLVREVLELLGGEAAHLD